MKSKLQGKLIYHNYVVDHLMKEIIVICFYCLLWQLDNSKLLVGGRSV